MARTTAYISALLLLAACQRSSTNSNTEMVSIASLLNIETNNRSVLITENIAIEGYVTANDEFGEFYNTIIFEDESAAAKILCDIEDSSILYPFGDLIRVNCNGLYLINHYGAITLGAEPTGEYTLDYIAQSKIGQYIKECTNPTQTHQPLVTTIDNLTPLNAFQYIELRNVIISNSDGVSTFCQRDPDSGRTVDTYHTVSDLNGNSAELSVDRLCSYADMSLPKGLCTIQAIVEYYDGLYQLTITDAAFIEM